MSELAKAVFTIQREFEKRFGLKVDVRLTIHDTIQKVDVESADEVARIVAKELELCEPRHQSSDDKGYAWIIAEKEGVSLAIFYPYEQKSKWEGIHWGSIQDSEGKVGR